MSSYLHQLEYRASKLDPDSDAFHAISAQYMQYLRDDWASGRAIGAGEYNAHEARRPAKARWGTRENPSLPFAPTVAWQRAARRAGVPEDLISTAHARVAASLAIDVRIRNGRVVPKHTSGAYSPLEILRHLEWSSQPSERDVDAAVAVYVQAFRDLQAAGIGIEPEPEHEDEPVYWRYGTRPCDDCERSYGPHYRNCNH